MEGFTLTCQLLGFPITAQLTALDDGWTVSITGGCRTHVGAVTLAHPGHPSQTMERPGHRDAFISRCWAEALAEATAGPVCVCCGIHYDLKGKEELPKIVAACGELLQQAVTRVGRKG